MIPRWHILLGLIFSALFWIIFPNVHWAYVLLIFLSAVFIDLDHYMCAVWKEGKISLSNALERYRKIERQEIAERKRGIFRKSDFHIFHTIEFHILIFALGFLWQGFFYILVGMLFHSLCDLIDMSVKGRTYRREFFLVNWIAKKLA